MSPFWILIIALTVVIGGVLALRLHAFLTLIVGALVVAAITPGSSITRYELRKDGVRIASVSPDGKHVSITDRKKTLVDGGEYDVFHAPPEGSPKRIARLRVQAAGNESMVGEAVDISGGAKLSVGDAVVSPEAAKAASKAATTTIGTRIAVGFGETAVSVGIIIAMASILGACLLESRAAERIVLATQRAIGRQRTPLAFVISGFVLAIPAFAEAVFYLLLPLAKAMWVQTRKSYVLYVLCVVAGATMAHSLVPPTPGPTFAAAELGVNIGTMMLAGGVVGLLSALCGYGYALWANRRWDIPLRDPIAAVTATIDAADEMDISKMPQLWMSLTPIVLPIGLIAADAVLQAWKTSLSGWKTIIDVVHFLGDKNLALTLAAGAAIATLVWQKRGDRAAMKKSIAAGVVSAGEIILVIAAGGALGYTLRQAGMSELVSAATPAWKLALLPMAWGITAVIRIAQGSATVAIITGIGIVAPVAAHATLGYHPVYVAVAVGCGSKMGMWMNDSGFWVISKMSGLTEAETLKTATVMISLMGAIGLLLTMLAATLVPGV